MFCRANFFFVLCVNPRRISCRCCNNCRRHPIMDLIRPWREPSTLGNVISIFPILSFKAFHGVKQNCINLGGEGGGILITSKLLLPSVCSATQHNTYPGRFCLRFSGLINENGLTCRAFSTKALRQYVKMTQQWFFRKAFFYSGPTYLKTFEHSVKEPKKKSRRGLIIYKPNLKSTCHYLYTTIVVHVDYTSERVFISVFFLPSRISKLLQKKSLRAKHQVIKELSISFRNIQHLTTETLSQGYHKITKVQSNLATFYVQRV